MTVFPPDERTDAGTTLFDRAGRGATYWLPFDTASVAYALPAMDDRDRSTSTPRLSFDFPERFDDVSAVYTSGTVLDNEGLSDRARVVRTDQQELLWMKAESGLTWDQLGKVFGVSRRAVHLWASGGRLNEANAAMLREFAVEVRESGGGNPDEVRSMLLARGDDGLSIVDRFRRRHVVAPAASVHSSLAPEEKIDAIRDPGVFAE